MKDGIKAEEYMQSALDVYTRYLPAKHEFVISTEEELQKIREAAK
jgi:hypothetical protein